MIYKALDPALLSVDERELSRRLSAPREDISLLDRRLTDELRGVLSPAYAAMRVSFTKADGGVYVGDIFTESAALSRFIGDSVDGYILLATLGAGVDRLIKRKAALSQSESFVADALADAYVESLCDLAERELTDGRASSRFSPGYSDLALSVGESIVERLDGGRRLGVRFTESGLMIPKKSVTAIICIKE